MRKVLGVVGAMALTAAGTANVVAQYHYRVVPGRGQKVAEVGDDFEDPEHHDRGGEQERQHRHEAANGETCH